MGSNPTSDTICTISFLFRFHHYHQVLKKAVLTLKIARKRIELMTFALLLNFLKMFSQESLGQASQKLRIFCRAAIVLVPCKYSCLVAEIPLSARYHKYYIYEKRILKDAANRICDCDLVFRRPTLYQLLYRYSKYGHKRLRKMSY